MPRSILGYDDYDEYLDGEEGMLGAFPMSRFQRPMLQRPVYPGVGRRFLVPPPGAGIPQVHPLNMPFPGASGPAGGQSTVAFPAVTFTNTSALAFTVTTQPNRLMRLKKLVAVVIRSAAAIVEIPYIAACWVGPINQFSDANPMPAEAFTSDNTFYLQGTPATQGTTIALNLTCSANPAAGQTISVIVIGAADAVM